MELDMRASSGTMELLNGVQSQATFLNGTASGDQQIDLSGSAAELNIALGEFIYFPPSGTTPTATINMSLYDLGATGQGPRTGPTEATVTINGVVTNPPPTLALPTGSLSVATNAGPLTFPSGAATGFFLTDGGASPGTLDRIMLSVTDGSLALPASDTSGPTALVTAQSFGGGSTLDLTGTVADLNLALPDLTFDPSRPAVRDRHLERYGRGPRHAALLTAERLGRHRRDRGPVRLRRHPGHHHGERRRHALPLCRRSSGRPPDLRHHDPHVPRDARGRAVATDGRFGLLGDARDRSVPLHPERGLHRIGRVRLLRDGHGHEPGQHRQPACHHRRGAPQADRL